MSERPEASRTVLLLGNFIPSLSVARALVAAGWRVTAGDGGEYSPARHSRAVDDIWTHPPISAPDRFFESLAQLLASRPDIVAIMPLRPPYVGFLARHRDRLPEGITLAMTTPENVALCMDKERMYSLAARVGLPLRPAQAVRSLEALRSTVDEHGYPCVVRPTTDAGARLPGGRKAMTFPDAASLRDALPQWPTGHEALLVQRFVDGPRHNVFFAADHGHVLASLETRIDRTDAFDGTGSAIDGVSVASDPRLTRATHALVEATSYHGVGFAQFLVPNEGDPHFLELNPRIAGSNAIAQRCGLDLAVAALELARGADWRPTGAIPGPGVRYVWTSRELFAIATSVVAREVGVGDSLRRLAHAIRAAWGGDVHLSWSWRDPLPTLMIYAHLLTLGPWRQPRRPRRQP